MGGSYRPEAAGGFMKKQSLTPKFTGDHTKHGRLCATTSYAGLG